MTAASVQPNFFYTPALKGLMQQLVHLANFGDGFSVVLGAKGSGKTTLSHEIQKHFDGAQELVHLSLDEGLELAESLSLLADSFGLPQGDDLSVGELLSELRHYVQSLAQDKKLLVLVVDNAHYFDDQAIGALVSLLQGGAESNFGLHLILFAEQGLETRIDRLQILDIAVYDFELPNLSPTELSSFLDARNTGVQQLTTSQVQKIWSLSKGLPGPALLALSGDENPGGNDADGDAKNKIPMGHIAAVILLACVLFWSISWHTSKKDDAGEVANSESAMEDVSSKRVSQESGDAPEVARSMQEGSESSDDELASIDSQQSKNAELEEVAQEEVVPLESEVESGQIADVEDDADAGGAAPSITEALESQTDEVTDLAIEENPDEELIEAEASSSGVESGQSETLQNEPISLREAPEVAVSGEKYEQSLVTATPPAAPADSADALKLTNDEAFILAQNPKFYALQVIAASKKASLEAYIQRQPNRDKLRMYRGKREGKSWYVVVEGVYSTRDSAMKARILLPKEQAKAGPWPRLFSSIQEEIEIFRRQ